jgi:hypothetical protein
MAKNYDDIARMYSGTVSQEQDMDELAKSFGAEIKEAELAQSQAQMSHPVPEINPQDMYSRQARDDSFLQNLGAGTGGALYGLVNLGPRQIVGMARPGEYEDWRASMQGLSSTPGGKTGQFLGYALPLAATTPFTGASVPGAALTAGLTSFVDPADSMAQRWIKTAIGATTGAVGQKVANVTGNMATNARASQQLRSYPGASDVRDKTLENTLKLGYKLPPSAAGKQSILESASGQIKTQQGMSDWNQVLTDRLIRSEFNDATKFGYRVTPNTPLTSQTMKEIRAAAGKAYERVKEIGPIELVIGKTKSGNKIVTRFNTADAVEQIKQLRHDGYQQLSQARSSGDPALLKQAKQTLDEAIKIEGRLDKALSDAGKKQLLDDLKASRQLIAKTYDVQDAIRDSVGRVDARDLGSLYEAGEKGYGPRLTGKLADVGKAGSAFRESMGLRGFETPRYSALDFAVSGMNIANATNPVTAAAGGWPLLRGLARDRLLSQGVQNKLIPKNTPPSAMTRAMPRVLDFTPNIPGIGSYPLSRTFIPSVMLGGLLAKPSE